MSTSEIASLLRAVADIIERGDSFEIAALCRTLAGSSAAKRKTRPSKKRSESLPQQSDLVSIVDRLLVSDDRATAKAALESERLSRRDLYKLAKLNNIHVVKEDTVEVINTKIVEALVGSRLSSKAIRGER